MTFRDELIQKLDAAYEDYRSAIDGLDERQFDRKWLDDGKWAAREITAHLTGWLGTLGGGLERMGRGEKPSPEGENWTGSPTRTTRRLLTTPRARSVSRSCTSWSRYGVVQESGDDGA